MTEWEDPRYAEYAARIRREEKERALRKQEEEARKERLRTIAEKPVEQEIQQHEHRRRLYQRKESFVVVGLLLLLGLFLWSRRNAVRLFQPDEEQIQFAATAGLPLEITNSVGMVFRLIPPGTYRMGSPPDEPGRKDDEGQHSARIPHPLYVAVTETTQEQYLEVMEENPSWFEGGGDTPVENMRWEQIVEFCNRLSAREGLAPAHLRAAGRWTIRLDRGGYRLPVEAEWEYACRARTTNAFYTAAASALPDAERALRRAGWYRANSGGKTRPVATREANRWGLFDMHGNVLEWCWDWHQPYPTTYDLPLTGPEQEGTFKVLRGGGWFDDLELCRSAARQVRRPRNAWKHAGFRCVRTAIPPAAPVSP
jgi:formylglycine-generating enzyme required for sulfatase activity